MKKHSFFLLAFLFIACNPIGKISVTNIHDLAAFQENSFIYALPRTRIKMNVMAISHFRIPGPYNAYAEKYLGIKGVASISNTQWELKEISMDSFQEPDPDQYYSLQAENPTQAINSLMKFTEGGLIIDQKEFTPFYLARSITEDVPEPLHFTDLSVKRNISDITEKAGKKSGEVSIDLPATKSKIAVKTTEQKAEEAANFIIKIRKRRFKLLSGQYDVFPEGTALETSVRELDAIEAEYLSLFTGKVYTDTIERVFYFTPQVGQDLERNVFCRFSEETGIQDALSLSGKPLVLEVKKKEFTAPLRDVQNPFMGPTYENILYYRIPEKAFVRVFYGSNNIIESEFAVFQYGVLIPCSTEMFISR